MPITLPVLATSSVAGSCRAWPWEVRDQGFAQRPTHQSAQFGNSELRGESQRGMALYEAAMKNRPRGREPLHEGVTMLYMGGVVVGTGVGSYHPFD